MSDKKYIGWTAKAVSTQYGEFINLSLKLSDMQAIVNEKGYVNMTVMKRKEVGQYWDTHYVVENDYKPKEKVDTVAYYEKNRPSDLDIPF